MDYIRQYKSFINSHYLSEGVRMTAGILIPAFVLSFFDLLSFGIVMSLGALAVSITDNPGPVHHRKNGMIACTISIFVVTLLINLVTHSVILTGILLIVSSLFFTLLNVFGTRPGSIGIAAVVVLILHLDESVSTRLPAINQALLITAGAAWYTCFSLLLYTFRPYKLAQQILGEWIQAIATYFRTRASLYKKDVNYVATYRLILQQQASVQEKQSLIRDVLLKTRIIIKESTATSRFLLITFVEVSDLFEKIITSYSRYSELHNYFDNTTLLEDLHHLILSAADDMDDIGLAIKSGITIDAKPQLQKRIKDIKSKFELYQSEHLNETNLENFISLGRIIQNAEDIVIQLNNIHENLAKGISDKRLRQVTSTTELDKFVEKQPINFRMLLDNFTFKSDIFRHSIRVTLALITGFSIANIFDIGHGYWILLTIIVIMKPAYSLSKNRNRDRLVGTTLGALIGLVILQLVHNNIALLVIMVVLMISNFSFMRTKYLISVLLMTPYILIFFHLLHPNDFRGLLTDRIIDTAIGSVIAFAASAFIFPTWEKYKIRPLMITAIEKVENYFNSITAGLTGNLNPSQQKLARKDAFIALANVSDAFNRMLNEPKYLQKNIEDLQRFVVVLHALVSYIATLGYYINNNMKLDSAHPLLEAAVQVDRMLVEIIAALKGEKIEQAMLEGEGLQHLNEHSNKILKQRLEELKAGLNESPTQGLLYEIKSIAHQFSLIHRSASEIKKISSTLTFEQ